MAPSEGVANCYLDVTIYLVEKLSMEEQAGSTTRSNKRRRIRSSMDTSEGEHGIPSLGKVKVKSSRLRRCSTYFDTCMSERWAPSKLPSEMEFHLEVQTEVKYYEDCFSRMHYLLKPIGSVACCIELLKVASQIGFQDVIDIGVKYLAAAPWSDDEEKLVHEFCSSAHLVPFDSLSELNARLDDLPLAEEGKLEKLSSNAKDTLSRYLLYSLPPDSFSNHCRRSRTKFATALHLVMSGLESGVVCDEVLEHVQGLLTRELARLLSCLEKELNGDFTVRFYSVEGVLSDVCWLFKVARDANADQALVVELLHEDNDHSTRLYSAIFEDDSPSLEVTQLKKWAENIYAIFQDVLEGKLFLNSAQRVTLFLEWHWLLCDMFVNLEEEHLEAFLVRFVTTLPQKHQEYFWMKTDFEPGQGILWEAHRTWISRMVTGKAQVQQQQLTASSSEVRSRNQD